MKQLFSIVVFVALAGLLAVTAQAQEGTISLLGLEEAPECRYDGDAIIPAVMSVLIPGLGQLANGQDMKGLVHLGVAIGGPVVLGIVAALTLRGGIGGTLLWTILPLAQLGWHGYSGFDAYSVSKDYCESE